MILRRPPDALHPALVGKTAQAKGSCASQPDAGRHWLRMIMEVKTDNSSRVSTAEIMWSKHIVLIAKTMDAGHRVKVNLCIIGHDGHRTKGLLPNAVDIRVADAEKRKGKIMSIPLSDRYINIITDKILDEFPDFSGVDLKTAWLALRHLSPAIRRDDEEAERLFCKGNQELAELTFVCNYDRLQDAVKQVLERNDLVPQRYWRFLQKMCNEAARLKKLRHNPLDMVWRPLRHVDVRDVQRISAALRDWSLTPQQMDRMVIPLLAKVEHNGKTHRRYEIDSHVMLQIFAACTLIHKNELVALNWGDIEPLPNGAAYANVTKFVDTNGRICHYSDGGKRRMLCRRLVLPELVNRCLQDRKRYIKKRLRISSAEMRAIPVFWQAEVECKTKIRRIKMKTAGKLYAELIATAQGCGQHQQSGDAVSVNVDDVVRYLDIGISSRDEFVLINNLRTWTASVCGAVNGELAYNSGVEPVATIDRHYIAWYTRYNLVATSAVFHRFTAHYLALLDTAAPHPTRGESTLEGDGMPLTWTPPADSRGTMRIEIESDVPVMIDIDTAYGHQTTMTCYEDRR